MNLKEQENKLNQLRNKNYKPQEVNNFSSEENFSSGRAVISIEKYEEIQQEPALNFKYILFGILILINFILVLSAFFFFKLVKIGDIAIIEFNFFLRLGLSALIFISGSLFIYTKIFK